MAEYIDREKAFNAVLKLIPKVDDDGYCWVIRGDAATAIDSIPAADVRPVVFCKDCKYAERVGMADGSVWCNENLLSRLDEDFCSRGAKMEES